MIRETLRLEYAEIQFRDVGHVSKQPLIFIHGSPSQYEDLSSEIRDYLEDNFRVISYQRPGFGKSLSRGRLTLDHQEGILSALIEQLELRTPLIVSHSIGCIISAYYAQNHSDVAGLIFLQPFMAPIPQAQSRSRFLKLLRLGLMGRVGLEVLARTVGASGIEKNLLMSSSPRKISACSFEEDKFMYSMPQTLLAILEEKELLVNAPDLRLRKELPVSIIAGDSDEISPSRTQVEPLLSKTPQSHVFYEKNAGHSLSHISLETFKTSLNSMTPKTGDRYATA